MYMILLHLLLMIQNLCLPNPELGSESQHHDTLRKVSKNGMTVAWTFEEGNLRFELFAPTKGWLAIGLNHSSELKGTNLIMASIVEHSQISSDRYILAPGKHEAIEVLGGKNHVHSVSGHEDAKGTHISFSIKIDPQDKYHFKLSEGRAFSLLMAFSREDDFAHHSMMRTSIRITL